MDIPVTSNIDGVETTSSFYSIRRGDEPKSKFLSSESVNSAYVGYSDSQKTRDKSYVSYFHFNNESKSNPSLSEWYGIVENIALKAKGMLDGKHSNMDVINGVINEVRFFNEFKIDLVSAIEKHRQSVEENQNNEEVNAEPISEVMGKPNVNLMSMFHLIKFYPVFLESKASFNHYIDADSHFVGIVSGSFLNNISILFKDDGEIYFRHVDKTSGRIRISGTAFFGKDKNLADAKKIRKILSFVSTFDRT